MDQFRMGPFVVRGTVPHPGSSTSDTITNQSAESDDSSTLEDQGTLSIAQSDCSSSGTSSRKSSDDSRWPPPIVQNDCSSSDANSRKSSDDSQWPPPMVQNDCSSSDANSRKSSNESHGSPSSGSDYRRPTSSSSFREDMPTITQKRQPNCGQKDADIRQDDSIDTSAKVPSRKIFSKRRCSDSAIQSMSRQKEVVEATACSTNSVTSSPSVCAQFADFESHFAQAGRPAPLSPTSHLSPRSSAVFSDMSPAGSTGSLSSGSDGQKTSTSARQHLRQFLSRPLSKLKKQNALVRSASEQKTSRRSLLSDAGGSVDSCDDSSLLSSNHSISVGGMSHEASSALPARTSTASDECSSTRTLEDLSSSDASLLPVHNFFACRSMGSTAVRAEDGVNEVFFSSTADDVKLSDELPVHPSMLPSQPTHSRTRSRGTSSNMSISLAEIPNNSSGTHRHGFVSSSDSSALPRSQSLASTQPDNVSSLPGSQRKRNTSSVTSSIKLQFPLPPPQRDGDNRLSSAGPSLGPLMLKKSALCPGRASCRSTVQLNPVLDMPSFLAGEQQGTRSPAARSRSNSVDSLSVSDFSCGSSREPSPPPLQLATKAVKSALEELSSKTCSRASGNGLVASVGVKLSKFGNITSLARDRRTTYSILNAVEEDEKGLPPLVSRDTVASPVPLVGLCSDVFSRQENSVRFISVIEEEVNTPTPHDSVHSNDGVVLSRDCCHDGDEAFHECTERTPRGSLGSHGVGLPGHGDIGWSHFGLHSQVALFKTLPLLGRLCADLTPQLLVSLYLLALSILMVLLSASVYCREPSSVVPVINAAGKSSSCLSPDSDSFAGWKPVPDSHLTQRQVDMARYLLLQGELRRLNVTSMYRRALQDTISHMKQLKSYIDSLDTVLAGMASSASG